MVSILRDGRTANRGGPSGWKGTGQGRPSGCQDALHPRHAGRADRRRAAGAVPCAGRRRRRGCVRGATGQVVRAGFGQVLDDQGLGGGTPSDCTIRGKRPGIPPENPLLARSAPGLSTARLPSQSTQFSQTDSGQPREILPRKIFLDSPKTLDEMGLDRQTSETLGWVH
jgi:hypothetical protein